MIWIIEMTYLNVGQECRIQNNLIFAKCKSQLEHQTEYTCSTTLQGIH